MTEEQEMWAAEFFDRIKRKNLDQTALAWALDWVPVDQRENVVKAIRAYMAVITAKVIP